LAKVYHDNGTVRHPPCQFCLKVDEQCVKWDDFPCVRCQKNGADCKKSIVVTADSNMEVHVIPCFSRDLTPLELLTNCASAYAKFIGFAHRRWEGGMERGSS
jgi:hypothetical protein